VVVWGQIIKTNIFFLGLGVDFRVGGFKRNRLCFVGVLLPFLIPAPVFCAWCCFGDPSVRGNKKPFAGPPPPGGGGGGNLKINTKLNKKKNTI